MERRRRSAHGTFDCIPPEAWAAYDREPYLIRLADAEQDEATQMAIMREALRGTFRLRYPNRHARKAEAEPDDSVT